MAWPEISQADLGRLEKAGQRDEEVNSEKTFEENLTALDKLSKTDPEAKKFHDRLVTMQKTAILEKRKMMHTLDEEVHAELLEMQKKLIGEWVEKMIWEGQSREEILKEYETVLRNEKNLDSLLEGFFLKAMKEEGLDNNAKIKIIERYQKLIPDTLRYLQYKIIVEQKIPYQDDETGDFLKRVLLRETTFTWAENNSIDQIVRARDLIWNSVKEEKLNMFDSRLHNILKVWQKGWEVKSEDLPHLANLLAMPVRPKKAQKFDEARNLRDLKGFLTEEGYHLAYQSIAQEVYATKLSSAQKGEVDELMWDINNPKKLEKYLVDTQTDLEKHYEDHPMKILAPKNLVKLLATVHGGLMALFNLIASRGDVTSNEWFWIGLGESYLGYSELTWNKILTGDDREKWTHKLNLAKKKKPFKWAKKVDDKSISGADLSLVEIMENKEEMTLLWDVLNKPGGLSPSEIARQNITVPDNVDKDTNQGVKLLTKNMLNDVYKTGWAEWMESNEDGYKRYLFYKALSSVGIKNKEDLDKFLSIQKMEANTK